MNVKELIMQYGEALRSWYVNQHNHAKCKAVTRLGRKIDHLNLTDTEIASFLKEHYSLTHLTPAI